MHTKDGMRLYKDAQDITTWAGDRFRGAVWMSWGQTFAVIGHRKFRVTYNPCSGAWEESSRRGE